MRASVAHAISDVITSRMEAEPTRPRRELQADVFIGAAQGIGVLLMASIHPDAWALPYQHITIPLNA